MEKQTSVDNDDLLDRKTKYITTISEGIKIILTMGRRGSLLVTQTDRLTASQTDTIDNKLLVIPQTHMQA